MNYDELIEKAMNGRSVNSMAKAWGVPQQTLDRWVKGKQVPDYTTAIKMAKEADVALEEVFFTLATEEQNLKAKQFKLQPTRAPKKAVVQNGFVQTTLILAIATCGLSVLTIYIM